MATPTYPSWNDKEYDLLKKMTANTALIADYEIGDVASVAGTANQVLVNGGTAPGTGNITLSLPSLISGISRISTTGTTTGVTDLLINPTTKASGNLIDAQVNSVSKFSVTSAGAGTFGGNLTVSGGTITGGTSGLSLASGGTNQSITLTPSGTGTNVLNKGLSVLNTIGQFSGTGAPASGAGVEVGMLGTTQGLIFAYNRTTSAALPLSLQHAGGNLLLGTTIDGGQKLQVAGSAAFTGVLTVSGTSGNTFNAGTIVTPTITSQVNQAFRIISTSTAEVQQGFLQTGNFGYYIQVGGSSSYPLILQPAGSNVLIGTTVDSSGLLQVGTNTTTAAGGMKFGTDVSVYRSGTRELTFLGANSSTFIFGGTANGSTTILKLGDGLNNNQGVIESQNGSLVFKYATNTTLTLDTSQNATFAGTVTPTGGIVGVTTNSNAAAGIVGEYVSSTVGAGSAITLTTATAANLTSITLTPGDWDVVFVPHFWADGSSVTGTQCVSSLSTTSATLDTTPDRIAQFPSVPTSVADLTIAIPATRFSVTSSTIIYGVVRSTFTVGTNKVYGVLSARRVR